MKFSMIFEAQLAVATPEQERQVLHECVEQAMLGDEWGFDRVWAVEHHALRHYAHMSAPEVFLSYVAAKTSRIRIGHGVVCLPFTYNHPVRVAERLAMLDILSGGRVDFGAGRGATPQELGCFGVTAEETQPQLEEALHMIPRIWTEEVFEWHGDLLDVPPRPIIPKPVQDPHPPIYLACTRQDTLNLAGKLGVGALCLGFAGPDDIAVKRKVYDAAVAERKETGGDVVGKFAVEHLSSLCPAIVLDDRDEARHIGFKGQRFFTEAINHWYGGGPPPRVDTDDEANDEVLRRKGEAFVAWLHQEKLEIGTEGTGLYNPNHAYGTVADAIEYVGRLADAGADEVMFLMQMGTVPHAAICQTIINIGREVIPHFV